MSGDFKERAWDAAMLFFVLFLMFFILAAYVDSRVPAGRPSEVQRAETD